MAPVQQGWVYVACIIDVFASRIVGCRKINSMKSDFVFDALEQALRGSLDLLALCSRARSFDVELAHKVPPIRTQLESSLRVCNR